LRTDLAKAKQRGLYKMGMAKPQDCVPGVEYHEPGSAEPANTKLGVLQSAEQMELEMLSKNWQSLLNPKTAS
jgi:hypothetical protein